MVTLCLFAMLGVAIMPWLGETGAANHRGSSASSRWIAFLGEFHPVFLHLPIGAVMLVLVMEIGSMLSRGKYQVHTTLALAFATTTAVLAAVFGHCLYLTGDFTTELAEEHKRDGIIFTILLTATFLIRFLLINQPDSKHLKVTYRIGLTLAAAAMISAGHHGGEITHGDPMDKAPWVIRKDHTMSAGDMADPIIYTHIIHPILEQKCISCHGEKKQKSGLRMDSYAAMIKGGDEEKCLVPGDTKESTMISFLHLPLEDDLRMPPEDKKQLTEEEKQILEWWVEIGAPEKARLSEVKDEVTPAIAKTLEKLSLEKQEINGVIPGS